MKYRFAATRTFKNDYLCHDEKTVARIDALVLATMENPFDGIEKPEALRFNLSEFWSQRIKRVDRLIYKIEDKMITFYGCRGHYK